MLLEKNKKIINYGQDWPNTAYIRAHIQEMEQRPYDGIVIAISKKREPEAPSAASWPLGFVIADQTALLIDNGDTGHRSRLCTVDSFTFSPLWVQYQYPSWPLCQIPAFLGIVRSCVE